MRSAKHQAVTVLLVEDEAIIRMASAAILEDAGYTVLEAPDGDAALSMLNANPDITVIVTDVQMPGNIDGLQLVEIVAREFPGVQTLVTSGRSGLAEARQRGATKFLSKPYSANAFQSAIAAALS